MSGRENPGVAAVQGDAGLFRLRGHHLLCLLGYRGMGYSPEFVAEMTRVHKAIRTNPAVQIALVSGPDDLCAHFPSNQPYHCKEASVYTRDAAILRQLGFEPGETRPWAEILEQIRHRVVPEDIPRLCETCPWRPYGVCEEGVQLVRQGHPLPAVD